MPFSRASSPPRDRAWVSRTAGSFFTIWAAREPYVCREPLDKLSQRLSTWRASFLWAHGEAMRSLVPPAGCGWGFLGLEWQKVKGGRDVPDQPGPTSR